MKILRKKFATFAPRQLPAVFKLRPALLKFTIATTVLALLFVTPAHSDTITVQSMNITSSPAGGAGEGCDGIDNDGQNGADDPAEDDTLPTIT